MTREIAKSMKRIAGLAPKLNAATDKANAIVGAVEKFLNEQSIGIPAEVPIPGEEEDCEPNSGEFSAGRLKQLCYDRFDAKFRIGIQTVRYCDTSDAETNAFDTRWIVESIVPWPSCPRHLKLRALEQLPRLVAAIADKAEAMSAAAAGSADTVEKMLSALSDKE